MQACALTDYGNMYGAVAFYNATKSAGVFGDSRGWNGPTLKNALR